MRATLRSPYLKVLLVYVGFLFAFLIILDVIMIRSERSMRMDIERNNLEKELSIIGTYVTESILRSDFATVERFIHEWGKKDLHIISLTAFTPEGRILAHFKRAGTPSNTLLMSHSIVYKEDPLIDLELVSDLTGVDTDIAHVTRQFITRSLLVITVFGLLLWFIFRSIAIKPMEREITRRKQAEEGLELAVRKRTVQLSEEILERKAAEEQIRSSLREKEVLLQEVHHRVKNNLQVISSLLEVQLSATQDIQSRDLLIESQSRLRTMAMVHEELYQSTSLDKVDFSHYVRRLVESLHRSYVRDPESILFLYEMEKAPLVVDTVIPCGLILNELVMNTIKHAFPGDRKGEVVITFKPLDDGSYHLAVQDNGVGLPEDLDIANPDKLGLQLVTMLVEQLNGTLVVENEHGTLFDISFREYHEAGAVMY